MPLNHSEDPTPIPPIPFTLKLDEDIQGIVNNFIGDLRTTFDKFFMDNVQLPLWQPPPDLRLSEETWRHINDLKIPTISPLSRIPLLLFHNLGQPFPDAQLANRINRLFSLGMM